MAGNDATAKFFEAINESADAIIDAIRRANDRGHRFTATLISEAQEGQRESTELAKKWIANPLDIPGFYSAMLDSATKAQGRALEVSRQWFSELGEVQQESRDVLQRVVQANRSMSEAGVEVARGVYGRAGEAVRSVADDGRRMVREASRTAESAANEV